MNEKTNIRAVIWDFGGVILRTENQSPRRELAKRLGISTEVLYGAVFNSPSALQATLGEISVQVHWDNVAAALSLPQTVSPDLMRDFWRGDQMDHDLIAFIRALRPHFQTALLSNAWSDARQWLTEEWHIADAFDELFISAELGVKKPDRHIYEIVTEKLRIEPHQAVLVDDFQENIIAARDAGWLAVHFSSPRQAKEELGSLLGGWK